MLGEDPRENWLAEWFRGLTMGVRIQIILFSVVGIVLAVAGGIALIQEPTVLLPLVAPDSKPVPGEPTRVKATNAVKDWRNAESMKKEIPQGSQVGAEGKGEVEAMRKLVAMDPKDADSWDRLGKALFVAQKLDEAIQSFEKSLELKPDVVEVLANLGVTSKSKGDKSRYAKVLEKLSTLDPKTAKELEAYQPAPAK